MADEITFQIEDGKLLFRNFTGVEKPFNPAGRRSFCVELPDDVATQMAADGWNVKYTKVREEGDVPQAYIQIRVKYGPKPPRIVLISGKKRTNVTEDLLDTLDWVDIAKADLVARAYSWDINGAQGITPYLKTLFLTVNEDDIERKYAEMEEN